MSLSDSFAVITLLTLLSLTGFSYYTEKFKLVEKILSYRYPQLTIKIIYLAGFLISIILLAFNVYLSSIVFYLSLLTYIVVKTNNQYRWMPNIIKTGIIFIIIYFILRHAERMSFWEWIKIQPS
jgi:hypothetical protein